MRAAQLRANRQTKCRQKGTGGKTAIRHISAASNLRSGNTLPPASFLIQRTKPPDCSRFTPGASGAGHYLTSAISPAAILPAITAILPAAASPASASLLRHLFSRKLFQLRINLSFRFLHSAIQKCIRISKLFISIRLLAVKHSHYLF